jgi:VWFA-related protein
MPKRAALLLLLIFALLINSFGQSQQLPQTPTQPQPQITPTQQEEDEVVRITTNLVQVDAVVTDKDGHQVTNLSAEDFEVLENGRPRQVTNLSYFTTAQPTNAATASVPAPKRDRNAPPVPPVRLRPEQVQRTIALVIDDLLMSAESIHYARNALRKYVDEQLQPGDLAAILRTSGGVGALQQFTSDRRQLYSAIERVRWSPRYGGKQTAMESTIGAEMPGALPGGVDAARSNPKDYDEYRQESFTIGTLGALNYVVRGLREMPGRKAVILFSDGLLLRDSKGDTTNYLSRFERLIDLANRASVVFYTIDARGLQPLGPTAADNTAGSPRGPGSDSSPLSGVAGIPTHEIGQRILSARSGQLFEGQAGLHILANGTGGTALVNQNDLGKGVRRALDDMSGYYLIGYRPDDSAFDPATARIRFNRLLVRVKNRPDLRVRSRSGYVGIADEAARPQQPRTRAGQLMAALVSPFGAGGVNLRLTSLFIDAPGGGSSLRSMLLIDPRTLTFEKQADGQYQTKLDIIAVTFGEDGRIVDQINRIETIRVPPDSFQRFIKQGMTYDLNVPIKRPGAYQLRIAVRDSATERVGSASQYVEVPNLGRKRLALSGLVVASPQPQSPATTPASTTVAKVADDLNGQQTDPATRRFRRGSLLDYGYVIYNARLDSATRRPRLMIQARLFREGKQVYAGAAQPLDPNQQMGLERIEAAGRLQLGSELPPGEYVLQIVVTDALAGKEPRIATQWIDIEIVG